MSSPVVEIRTVPLVVERNSQIPLEEDEFSGFPFDRDSDRDGHLSSQLEDIAKRHPELAGHLDSFTRTSNRPQQAAEDQEFRRRFARPFGERFERFAFPFDADDFDPEQYAQQFSKPHQEFYQQQNPDYQQTSSHQEQPGCHPQQRPNYQYQQHPPQSEEVPQPQSTGNPPPSQERERNNIQQSNTIDLGQKQEPVNDRTQRSMSAPPTEKGPRFTSSIKIPVNQSNSPENMAQSQGQPETTKVTERIIPIHIEGRDEPILPKNMHIPPYSQPNISNSIPQPERIFGQRPEQFTQYINREPMQSQKTYNTEERPRQQKYQPQHNAPNYQSQQRSAQHQQAPSQSHQAEEIPIPVQRDVPQQKQRAHSPQSEAEDTKPVPQQQRKPLGPIEQIQIIQKDVSALMEQVHQFKGKSKDKQYVYLDEMLTRNLLKLDNVDTQGQENIRSARKEAIKCIEKAICVLEAKAGGSSEPTKVDEQMEVDDKQQETASEIKEASDNEPPQPMETEPQAEAENKNESLQQMEITPESPLGNVSVRDEQEIKEEDSTKGAKVEENKDDKVEAEESNKVSEEHKMAEPETHEGLENSVPVAEVVKMFEDKVENKETGDNLRSDESKDAKSNPVENKETNQQSEQKVDGESQEKEDKKDRKKGKKKVVKKD